MTEGGFLEEAGVERWVDFQQVKRPERAEQANGTGVAGALWGGHGEGD